MKDVDSPGPADATEAPARAARSAPGARTRTQRLGPRPAPAAATPTSPSQPAAAPTDDPFALHLPATVAPAPGALLDLAADHDAPASAGATPVYAGTATRGALAELGVRGAAHAGRAFVGDDDPAVMAHEVAHARGADEAGAMRAAAGLPWQGGAPAAAAQFWGGAIRGTRVNLRPRAQLEDGTFPQLDTGTAVEVVREEGRWLFVRTADGQEGYVAREYVTRNAAAADGGTTQGGTTDGGATTQGATTLGATTQGATTQGATTQGATTQGSTTQGATTQGATTQGATTDGGNTTQGNTTQGNTTDGTGQSGVQGAAPANATGAVTAVALDRATARRAVAHGQPMDAPLVGFDFLGRHLRGHPVLQTRLARAEQHLAQQYGVQDRALGDRLGIREGYRHHRPGDGYHHYGLAIDINYEGNPYIGGQYNAGDTDAMALIWRAVWLTGTGEVVSPQDSWGRRDASTADRWAHFAAADRAVETYLAARNDVAQIQQWIAAGNLTRQPPLPRSARAPDRAALRAGPLATADAAAWRTQINADMTSRNREASNWGRTGAGDARRDTGIMDLDRALVIALCDVGGLGWGATDFGDEANGDMMHFDCRFDYAQPAVAAGVRAWRAAPH